MKITKYLLESKGACKGQAALFGKLFPDGVELTEALCIKHAHDFNFDWAAGNLPPLSAREEYRKAVDTALEKYRKAVDTALEEYEKATAPAREEYRKATAPAEAEYEKATAPAREEYLKAIAPAWATLNEARAIAFFKAATGY